MQITAKKYISVEQKTRILEPLALVQCTVHTTAVRNVYLQIN